MNKDTQKTQGRVRLQNFRLPKYLFKVSQLLNFLQMGRLATILTMRFGVLQWDTGFFDNMIMNAGKAAEAGLVGGIGSVNPFNYMAVGTSNTAVVATQTALAAELATGGMSRSIVTPTLVTVNTTNDTLQLQHTFNCSITTTVQEIGLFNASSVGTMLNRSIPTAKALVSGDSLVPTYQVTYN